YAIHLDEVEENELKLMIMSLICRRRPAEQTENPKEFLDERTYLLFVRILEYLKDEFDLDDLMEDETFCYKFAGHLKNLLMRLRSGYSAKNMLTESIRESCPLTFECAIGIADIIEQEYGLQMDMSETAYLALHIGDRLESRLEEKEKISCLVIFPQYYHVANRLLEKIEKEFKDELLISFAYETLPEEKPEAELIISTVPIRGADKEQFVLISPFCNQKDILAIKERVQKIKGLRSNRKLQGRLKHVLNQKYFVKNPTFGSAEEAITYMTKRLIEDGMAAEDFTEKVLDREKQASTAFGKIALPHSLKMMGKSTGIFVIISEKPIPWHTQYVNVVLLLCISERDRMLFYDIFDNLISLFVEEKYVQEIAKCKDYTEFENLMLEYVGGK
ncbi:MAG: BglG family transcription antiterminator, partial [Roseburia hominis]